MQIEQMQIAGMPCNLFLPKDYRESGRFYPAFH